MDAKVINIDPEILGGTPVMIPYLWRITFKSVNNLHYCYFEKLQFFLLIFVLQLNGTT
jgi:hypothetical protein